MSAPIASVTDDISYDDLYARWERGNWSATEIDFTQDRIDWHEKLTEEQRRSRAVALHALLPRRGRGHRRALALHRRRAARGAEVLPRHPAGRRGAPRGLLQALHGRGRRRSATGRWPAGMHATERCSPGATARSSSRLDGWPTSCAATVQAQLAAARSRSTTWSSRARSPSPASTIMEATSSRSTSSPASARASATSRSTSSATSPSA